MIQYMSGRRIQGGVENVTTSTNGTTADATNSSSGTSQVTGKNGNALFFESGRYTIPKEATDFGTEWSFNFWVNPQSASGNDYFLHHTSSSHVGSSFYMYNSDDDPSGSGGVMVNVRDSTNTRLTLDSSDNHIVFDINSLAGTWVMCTVTWNNSDKKLRLYQNGSLRATSKAWTHSSAGNMAVSGADWTIGNYQTQTGSTYSARSKFDEWSFWSTTLSQADITELYTGIKATELSNSTAISKLKIYYNFEQGANNTITNQAPTTVSVRDAKPTNVQVGSRFEETDTRNMYYYADPLSVDDDLSTDKGWVSNTSDWTYNASGDYIDFATVRRSQTAQQIYIDMQDSDYLGSGNNLSDSKWTFRCKLTIGALASSGNVLMYIGFTDNLNDSGAISQHGAMIMVNTSPTENSLQIAVSTRNFETSSSPDRENANVYTNTNLPSSSVRYMEMKRDGAVFTLKAFTDSSFSTQSGSTATVTKTGTALTGLRYLKAFNDSEQNGSTSTGTRLDEIKIYNGATSTDTAWSELG